MMIPLFSLFFGEGEGGKVGLMLVIARDPMAAVVSARGLMGGGKEGLMGEELAYGCDTSLI